MKTKFFEGTSSIKIVIYAIIIITIISFPFIATTGLTRLATTIIIYSISSLGLMLIFGYTGMMCAGYAAFYGTGAYISAILAKTFGFPFWACLLISAIGTGLVGSLIALPCLRLSADFVGLISTAFLNIFLAIVRNWTSVTGGPVGIYAIPSPTILGKVISSKTEYYFLMLSIALLCYFLIKNLMNSKIGRNMQGIRDNEIGTEAIGVKSKPLKIFVFAVGSALGGISGCLYGFYLHAINPMNFLFAISTTFVQMCVLGGLGTLKGAAIGAILVTALPEIFRPLALYRLGIGGLVMVVMMIFRPQGIAGSRAFASEHGIMYRIQQKLALRKVLKEKQN